MYGGVHWVPPVDASMKAPPKRKGNPRPGDTNENEEISLNESPSEKEGKCLVMTGNIAQSEPQ